MPDNPIDAADAEATASEANTAAQKGSGQWDRHALDFEHPEEETSPPAGEAGSSAPVWNKGQVGEEFPDGHHSPDASPEELATSKGGLSGGGANSGGGERFGENER
jgi:hypothetical protein